MRLSTLITCVRLYLLFRRRTVYTVRLTESELPYYYGSPRARSAREQSAAPRPRLARRAAAARRAPCRARAAPGADAARRGGCGSGSLPSGRGSGSPDGGRRNRARARVKTQVYTALSTQHLPFFNFILLVLGRLVYGYAIAYRVYIIIDKCTFFHFGKQYPKTHTVLRITETHTEESAQCRRPGA